MMSEDHRPYLYPQNVEDEAREEDRSLSANTGQSQKLSWEYTTSQYQQHNMQASFPQGQIHSNPQHDDNPIWGTNTNVRNDTDSIYSTSTNQSSYTTPSWYGHPNNSHHSRWTAPGQDLASSMGNLQINQQHIGGGASFGHFGTHSVASMNSANTSSLPGIVGASSGSTGGQTGTSSMWGNVGQPPAPTYTNPYSSTPFPTGTHYGEGSFPLQQSRDQQKKSQPFHTSAARVPPGFLPPLRSGGGGDDYSLNSGISSHAYHQQQRCDIPRESFQKIHHLPNATNRGAAVRNLGFGVPLPPPSLEEIGSSDEASFVSSKASSEAIRMLMKPPSTSASISSSQASSLLSGNRLPLDVHSGPTTDIGRPPTTSRPILPSMDEVCGTSLATDTSRTDDDTQEEEDSSLWGNDSGPESSAQSKKQEWLDRMTKRMQETPIGQLDPATTPIAAVMNAWAKTKSAKGATMVESWLNRAQEEYEAGNTRIVPTTKMFTMSVDAWAKSGEGVAGAQRAEAILQHMHGLYLKTGQERLRPTTGIFNAVINSWARAKDQKMGPSRAEQILHWMYDLHKTNPTIQPDKYTFNTVIHAYAKAGEAEKSQDLLKSMQEMYLNGNILAKPDTITFNVVINSLAKSGGKGAAVQAEKLLETMHDLHDKGDPDIRPNVVTYGAVIDAHAKSAAQARDGAEKRRAAMRADALLARMIQLYQMDPVNRADLQPNTYVFNTVINCHSKSMDADSAAKAEEMLLAMTELHSSGMANLKPDAFTYTAVIDAWAKSGYRGAASRAHHLLDQMESKYMAGDLDLRPNTFTYNAVLNSLAKSQEPGSAGLAEQVLQNMVNRYKNGKSDDVRPTTINFNTVLDAWAKSGGGRQAAERAEEILQWMHHLHGNGNQSVAPDTITFNAVLDSWARANDRMGPHRAEQILDHMDELFRAGNKRVKPDTYTYNTLINAWAKSSERGSAGRAARVLDVMMQRYKDGDETFKPNTRSYCSVVDAIAKSGEKHAARRAEEILNGMITNFESTKDEDVKPNVHTANAVCNACAFTKVDGDRAEALEIAFRVFNWLASQPDMSPDAYTYTILLSVCANLLPRDDGASRFAHAKMFFEKCCRTGYVNDYVLRKLRQTVTDEEYYELVNNRRGVSAANMPDSWTRNVSRNHRGSIHHKKGGGGRGGGRGGGGRGGGGRRNQHHHNWSKRRGGR